MDHLFDQVWGPPFEPQRAQGKAAEVTNIGENGVYGLFFFGDSFLDRMKNPPFGASVRTMFWDFGEVLFSKSKNLWWIYGLFDQSI